jgi:hypothetical protein
VGEHEAVKDEQHDDFGDQARGEHDGRQPDVEIGQDRDQRNHEERKPWPAYVHAEFSQFGIEEERESAC